MTRTRVTGVLALAVLAFAGCSSSNDDNNPSNGVSLSFTPCTRQDYWPVVMLALQDGYRAVDRKDCVRRDLHRRGAVGEGGRHGGDRADDGKRQ